MRPSAPSRKRCGESGVLRSCRRQTTPSLERFDPDHRRHPPDFDQLNKRNLRPTLKILKALPKPEEDCVHALVEPPLPVHPFTKELRCTVTYGRKNPVTF